MPTEPDGAPETDQPEVEAPEAPETDRAEGDVLDTFDLSQVPEDASREWLGKRHSEMTGSLTRKNQELAEQRRQVGSIVQAVQDRDHPDHEAVMEELGLATTDEDDLYDEGPDQDARVERLERQLQEFTESAEEDRLNTAETKWLANAMTELEAETGTTLSQEEQDIVRGFATSNRFDDGEPDIHGGFERLNAAWTAKQKAYEKSKKAPKAPGAGLPAARDRDTSTRAERIALGAKVAEASAQYDD